MNAVVTGASGFVGGFLCQHLVERGWNVTAMVRKTSKLRWLEGIKLEKAFSDICLSETLVNAVDGTDVVFHVAGLVKSDSRSDFMKINFEGTMNLVNACLQAGKPPRRFVFISSQAAAGPSPGPEGIDENFQPRPVSAYGESKLAAEKWLAGVKGIEIAVVRPSAVYGPRDPETLNFFKIVSKLRIRPLIGDGSMLVSMIDVRDLIEGIRLAGEIKEAAGGTYFLSSPQPYSIAEVMKAVSVSLGKTSLKLPVSRLLLSAGAEISQFIAQFVKGGAALSHLKVAELSQKYWVVRTERASKELGFSASTSLGEGLETAARWYIDNGWI